MSPATAQQPRYLVLCGNHIPEYAPERILLEMTWDRTVDDIATMQFPALSRVLEIGTGRDVTKDMVTQAADRWAIQGDPLSLAQFDLIEMHLGTRIARQFELEDA